MRCEQRREHEQNERADAAGYQIILNPICICLGSRVRVAWPNEAGTVALVIVVGALALFNVTPDTPMTVLNPAFVPPMKFARLNRLKMSHRNCSLMPLDSGKFL